MAKLLKVPKKRKASSSPIAPKSTTKKGSKVRTIEDVERDIERAEAHAQSLEEALSEAALQADAMRLTQLSLEYDQAKARVDELFAEWERLADVAS